MCRHEDLGSIDPLSSFGLFHDLVYIARQEGGRRFGWHQDLFELESPGIFGRSLTDHGLEENSCLH